MHRLLKRQLKRYLPDPQDQHRFKDLLEVIDQAYQQQDVDREMLERSLQLTSEELLQRNHKLRINLQEQAASQQALKQSYQILDATLNASQEGVLVINTDGHPAVYNQRYLALSQLSPDEIQRMDLRDLMKNSMSLVTEPQKLQHQVESLINSPGDFLHEVYRSHNNHWVEAYACNDPVAGFIWMLRDTTEIREKEQTIEHQARHDALTQLPNRVLLLDRMENAIQRAQRQKKRLAVCYLDLDAFKAVNDSLGHDAGDVLLQQVSQRLKNRIRESDTLARIGGDEFVILLDAVRNQEEVLYLAERLLETLAEPIPVNDRTFFIGASMGIAMYPNDGTTPGALLKNADIAMYRAKENGKNRFHFFTPSLERIAQHRLTMETNLRHALENDELELFYQPKFFLQQHGATAGTTATHSFEALIRWPQKDGSFIPPDSFIHIAEDAGMIGRVSDWVLRQAAQQAKHWYERGFNANISINISPKQFLIPDFDKDIISTLETLQLPHNLISIEITESLLMQDLNNARQVLEYFRSNGIYIYLDDFGTGFSSLNYLKNLPVDAIKIDRTFVKDLSNSNADQAIASSIIALGKNLDMLVVAEGVETSEQAKFLIDSGCDLAQGYFYGRPLPAEQAEQFLTPLPLSKPG
ncbi:bifunctional diguanylate cyclase/phosphodiesterase [Bacterioplanoides sp. SCSIO 12839]|uniref:putative bifunctional diguanylate cyclase/phosphodiesterase n=1 Tax=Bacterioplanoides sp. SCSIO 12839 TaxID=2829569 RepID=UPI002104D232|nr:EAL domain-containing protein [Bacterioplanoides sp. SCSIO 12839]UTW47322.1 EAL domain-containing protein [Bacterioplanoides sp. SCSIO 12839]